MSGYKALVFVCLLAIVIADNTELNQAGQQFSAAFQSLGQYFVRQYKNVQDFFAGSKEELERKVADTANFLSDAKNNMKALMDDAVKRGDTQLQNALNKVNGFSQDVNNFQAKVKQSVNDQTQQLETEWQNQVKTMYDNGLDKIIQTAQAAKAGSGSAHMNVFLLSTVLVIFAAKLFM